MRKSGYLALALLLAVCLSLAAPKGAQQTFTGAISDKMCGAKHMMPGGDKACTLECVKNGSKFVLVDAKGTVYDLSEQEKPKDFAGQKVKVTGSLNAKTKTITVTSIEAAQ